MLPEISPSLKSIDYIDAKSILQNESSFLNSSLTTANSIVLSVLTSDLANLDLIDFMLFF